MLHLRMGVQTPAYLLKQYYQVKHDAQRGDLWRWGVPEVYPYSYNKTDLTDYYQLLTYNINTIQNPKITADMTGDKWRVVYDFKRWGMNGTGFNESGDPRRDWVNQRDLSSPFPKFDKFRLFGGALIAGIETYSLIQTVKDAGSLLMTMIAEPRSLIGNVRRSLVSLVSNNVLELETLRIQDPAPDLSWLLDRPWLVMDAVNVTENGISKFPQGTNGNRVFIPIITSHVETVPLSDLIKMPIGYNPFDHDPYKL